MDTKIVLDFDVEKAEERILCLQKNAVFFPVSAKKDEGVQELADYLIEQVKAYQKN